MATTKPKPTGPTTTVQGAPIVDGKPPAAEKPQD